MSCGTIQSIEDRVGVVTCVWVIAILLNAKVDGAAEPTKSAALVCPGMVNTHVRCGWVLALAPGDVTEVDMNKAARTYFSIG